MTEISNIFISNNNKRNQKFGMFRDGDINLSPPFCPVISKLISKADRLHDLQKKAFCKDASSQTV